MLLCTGSESQAWLRKLLRRPRSLPRKHVAPSLSLTMVLLPCDPKPHKCC